jgi:hypothetical protein
VRAFTEYRDKLLGEVNIPSLFPQRPLLEFHPENTTCCHSPLHVQKTRTRQKATTMDIGMFAVKETVLECGQCRRTYPSQELKKLIPPGCNFGYDVLVHVGKSLFLQYKNEMEIQVELKERNISISCSEIAYLARKFVVCLAVVHKESSARIKQALDKKGGYILHVDAMGEGGSPRLMSALDEISRIVLGNVKIPTENASQIIPFFQRIKKSFGKPIAIVRDMGKGIYCAVGEVFKNIPDFICHFHFLRDIGKDLFGQENDLIRKRLRAHGICGRLRTKAARLKKKIDTQPNVIGSLTAGLENGVLEEGVFEHAPPLTVYTLIEWALQGKNQGHGYGFPFDRPYLVFYQRLRTIYLQGKRLQKMRLADSPKDNMPFRQLCSLLQDALGDEALKAAVERMQEKIGVFDKLREAMRIAEPLQGRGLNDDGEDADIKTIKQRVEKFRKWLIHDERFKENKDYRKMVEQIDRYWEKLFADPIVVNTPRGKISIQPQRTNNILERFFRTIRYGYRKKSGNNSMSKTIKAMLAETPLVKNLNNPEYVKIILKGKATLEERFAEIDSKIVRAEMKKTRQSSEKVPTEIKALINKPQLPKILVELFANQLKT